MKLFLFSDLHANNKALQNILSYVKKNKIDAILFAGDFVNMGEPVWYAEKAINEFKKLKVPFFWVPGNNDFGRSYHKVQAIIKSVEGRVVEIDGERITGVGGSPASWAGQYQGEINENRINIAGTIFISHVPPPGVFNWLKNDNISPIDSNSKSQALNSKQIQNNNKQNTKQFGELENSNLDIVSNLEIRNSDLSDNRRFSDSPKVHICGHIHHKEGVAYLGQTKIIKLASSEHGHAAIIDTEDLSVEFIKIGNSSVLKE